MPDTNDSDLVKRRLALQDALAEGERAILQGDVLTQDAAKKRMQKWLEFERKEP
ncbi:putative transcriptional regulator [Litorivivens lipolytica]|uniref:Putative transcriptional regulator n=1 Tax=Litorivivens lipolytica TaxID=1524264 RepID=A0A7W4Z7M7_9GAMM|nr:hypothetical protein [Litorivivens lipolytica]MBB3048185.1 putative transcriptional regulator [Litorivivens lipolytica]